MTPAACSRLCFQAVLSPDPVSVVVASVDSPPAAGSSSSSSSSSSSLSSASSSVSLSLSELSAAAALPPPPPLPALPSSPPQQQQQQARQDGPAVGHVGFFAALISCARFSCRRSCRVRLLGRGIAVARRASGLAAQLRRCAVQTWVVKSNC